MSRLGGNLAIVTVLYNSEKHVEGFIDSLSAQTDRSFKVFAIDNASQDRSGRRSEELASQWNIQWALVTNKKNVGIAEANNQGIRQALEEGYQHIILSNNDIALPPDVIQYVSEKVVGTSIKVWTPKAMLGNSSVAWYEGGYLAKWRARGMHKRCVAAEVDRTVVSYAPTCFMYVKAEVFNQLGLMDPDYFVYYDDTDFCKRLQEAGIQIFYDENIVYRHFVGGSSGGSMSQFFFRISTRNKFYYIYKHYSGAEFFVVTSLAFLGKLCQLCIPGRAKATFQGLLDGVRLIRSIQQGVVHK